MGTMKPAAADHDVFAKSTDRPKAARVFSLTWLVLLALGCQKTERPQPTGGSAAVPVVIAAVETRSIAHELQALGHVEASSSVSITAQVSGRVQRVHFGEGDSVKQGQILFTIDPRPYAASLKEAEAQLAKNKALLAQAELDVRRTSALAASGVISEQEKERANANQAALSASIAADRAAAESARLDLEYTTIRSPISGRAGAVLVHAGNVVRAGGEAPLVVIRTLAPAWVRFTVPEQYLSALRGRMQQGKVPVEASPRDRRGAQPLVGQLTFLDNTVDDRTGAIGLKAEFENPDESLWPGQFVDVRIELAAAEPALVAPEAAVQQSQDGPFTYVVGAENKAELRRVKIARVQGPWAVVTSGLKAGEQVVVDGQVRLSPGSLVQATSVPQGEAAGSAPVPDSESTSAPPVPSAASAPAPPIGATR